MIIPSATYRIQFNHTYQLSDLEKDLGYLRSLGISAIYASPVLKATPGSMHGYDITDPLVINPEIGSVDELRQIASKLKNYEMSWLQDIVPNHMSYSVHNARLLDTLEKGVDSQYYNYFDIDWQHPDPELTGKLMLPVLEKELDRSLPYIKLMFSESGFEISYNDLAWPVAIHSLSQLASVSPEPLRSKIDLLQQSAEAIPSLAYWKKFKTSWCLDIFQNPADHAAINKWIATINDNHGKLKEFLKQQNFALVYWKTTDQKINYRRFFTVNELICLRMEDQKTFDEYHQLLSQLHRENVFQGFRIDHIDGLADPREYCQRLRGLVGDDAYIIAEKILGDDEDLPGSWPVEGTSGYEYLATLNQLFTDTSGEHALKAFYKKLVAGQTSYESLIQKNKTLILQQHMGGELNNLTEYFMRLNLAGTFSRETIKSALAALMISLPVYRIYPGKFPLKGHNLERLTIAFEKAIRAAADRVNELLHLKTLFTNPPGDQRSNALQFLQRLMQFTGPLTAKGVEDTTFYLYNPLLSHDEVGESPASMSISTAQFHEQMQARQKISPLSLNATSTHDTKRGEDARLRLNVLSEIPQQWITLVEKLIQQHKAYHRVLAQGPCPVLNDQYFIYQSIVAGLPPDGVVTSEWQDRLKEYMIKVVREAKVNSNWAEPKKDYEDACSHFIDEIFAHKKEFEETLLPFIGYVDQFAMSYSLGMVVIKIASPGIPDFYQGSELWNHSFVDPDNRRKVDFEKRRTLLSQIESPAERKNKNLFGWLSDNRRDGAQKLFVTLKCLQFRRKNNDLFIKGNYLPLYFSGHPSRAVVFARSYNHQWVIVAVRTELAIEDDEVSSPEEKNAQQTASLALPPVLQREWKNVITGELLNTDTMTIGSIFKNLPVAMLYSSNSQN